MRNLKAVAAGSLIGLGTITSMPAAAAIEGSVGIATEYVFRGISTGSPQVWGGLDWSGESGLYAGTWISSTGGGNEEVDYYAGFATEAGDLGLDFGAIYYAFPSQPSQGNTGITEVYAGISTGPFSGYLWYAPAGIDGPDDDEYAYLDLNLDLPLTDTTSLGLHAGLTELIGDAFDPSLPGNTSASDDGPYDLGVALNVGDFFVSMTYLEGSQGGFSTIAGYSWSVSDVFK